MAHPAISSLVDTRQPRDGVSRNYTWDGSRWNRTADTGAGMHSTTAGTLTIRSLTASTKNPPNQHGWRDPSPYSGTKQDDSWSSSQFIGERKDSYGTRFRRECDYPRVISGVYLNPDTTKESALKSATIQKALTKFADKSIDLSVAFAERKSTANLAHNTVKQCISFARKARRGLSKGLFNDISSAWLTYRYGWSPAIADLYGALVALEKADSGHYARYRVTTRAKQTYTLSSSSSSYSTVSSIPCKQVITSALTGTVKVRMDAILDSSALLRLQEVGVTDPASTAWELLPYSFVVDWFLGVGDWLAGVNALDAYQFGASCTTVHRSWKTKASLRAEPSGQYYNCQGTMEHIGSREYFTRTAGFSPPASKIIVKSNPLNLTRLTDSIALLSQLLGKKGPT